MNTIQMIPISELYHHPENPRLDLGDLTELAESIKANGVMQNLTVVRGHRMSKQEWTEAARAEGADKAIAEASYNPENAEVSDGYTVVIGNRRMEAAKLAGLAEVPCVIRDMDHKTQVATMLMENMQRTDLTVYEQAQGFQMMMDLGFSVNEIGEKTGFGETTVRRRLKMAELDRDQLKKAVGKQISMDDLDRLSQLESLKERNALLKEYGENNFNWKLTRAIKVQKAAKVRTKAHQMLQDAKVKKVPDKDKYALYSGGYEKLYKSTLELDKWDGKRNFIPKADSELMYTEDETDISFYVKKKKQKAEPVKKSEKELEEARRRDLAWKTVERFADTSAELREKFVEGMNVSPKNAMQMMQWAMTAAFSCMMSYTTPTMTLKKKFVGATHTGNITDSVIDMAETMRQLPQKQWPELILLMFEGDWKTEKKKPPHFAGGSRSWQMPEYKKNATLELCYQWLTEFGYQMSTEEIEMMAGTHSVFQTEVSA